MKKVVLFVLIISSFSCNNYTGKFREVKDKSFIISLPDWLEKTDDLSPEAYYQFKSRYRNTYGIIIKDKKDKPFKEYQKDAVNVLRNFKELTNLLVLDSTFSKNHIRLELLGDMEQEKIFYWHNTYESANNYYQLVIWTRSYDRKQKYGPVIEKIIQSFQIID